MSAEVEVWIEQALATLALSNRKVEFEAARGIRNEIENRFVSGAPRVWWNGLHSVRQRCSSESSTLSSLVQNPEQRNLFVPEGESGVVSVYELSAREAEAVVDECPYFEYYFLDQTADCLIAETDHNEFLVAEGIARSPK